MLRRAASTAVVWLVALGASASAGPPALPDGTELPPHVPGEAIIAFRDETSALTRSGALAEIDATGIETLGSTGAWLVRLNGSTVEQAIERLSGRPEIAFIEPNFLYSTQAIPNDPQFQRLWGLRNQGQTGGTPGADIHAPEVWDIFHGSRASLVAVIDTGIDYTHPDLAANIWTNPGEVPDNGVDDDGNGFVDDVHGWDFVNDDNDPMDDHHHGTHVAGTIGAVGNDAFGIAGVNWAVSILALKFLDAEGSGTTAAAIAAVDYAVDNGARILNNSWGGSGFSQALRLAIERANRKNALFVAAAGNNLAGGRNNDLYPFFPATYPTPNIVAVAATDHDDLLGSFSNFGLAAVDLAAPGVDVYSTFPNEDYGFLSGTSMATPHVAGALALLLGRYPDIAAEDAKALLLESVDAVPGLAGRLLTGGRLNASLLLSDPDDLPPAAVTDLRAGNPDANRVDLVWSATGDDGLDGTASRYDLRFAPFPIDDGNFAMATAAVLPPLPAATGTDEQMRVTGLAADTTYWFALRVLDEYGNRSPLSNVVQQRTLAPPVARIAPDAISIDLFTGESAGVSLRLENLGIGELIYDVTVEGISPTPVAGVGDGGVRPWPGRTEPDAVTLDETTAGGAHEIDRSPDSPHRPPRSLAGGNKEVTDATAAQGSTYSYHEFNAPAGHSNGIYQPFDAARPVYVSFWVRPGSAQDNDAYFVISDSAGSDAIFFYATSSGYFHVNADVGGNLEVPYAGATWYHVEFRDIDYDETTFDYYVDGSLIQTDIRFRFPGVRNLARLDLYSFDPGAEAWWDEIVLTELPPVLPVAIEPASGVLPAAGHVDLAVLLDATGLNGGNYDADLVVATNDPARPELHVPAVLRVTGAPDIAVSATDVDFGALFLGDRGERTLTVSNRGTDLLEVRHLAIDHPDFAVDASPFELAPGEIRELTLAFLPTSDGVASGRLTIETNDPDGPALQVTVHGTGLLPPDIEVLPAALSETLVTGGHVDVELQIRNSGFSDLQWEIAFPGDPHPTLEAVLQALEAGHAQVTGAIPSLHPLTGGRFGTSIIGGGNNMFDAGNVLSTDRGGFLEYSDGEIVADERVGETGRFFTQRYPGLFVLAADLDEITFFNIAGSVGSGEQALVDEAILEAPANGLRFRVFVMRSSGTRRPSVNHLVIVEDRPGLQQRIQSFENQYSHVVYGLGGSTRLYYLLFGGREGRYHANSVLGYLTNVFFDVLDFGPPWLEVGPRLGQIGPGTTALLHARLDAFALDGADYATAIRLLTNIPDNREVVVPVDMRVDAAGDITLSRDAHDFGNVFVGQTAAALIVVSNHGSVELNVTAIVADHAAFSPDVGALAIGPGESREVTVRFAPTTAGEHRAVLHMTSNDPDEAVVTVALSGVAADPPVIDVTPMDIALQVGSEGTATRTLIVRNLAGALLSFDVLTDFVAAGPPVPAPPTAATRRAPDDTPLPGPERVVLHTRPPGLDPVSKSGAADPEVFFFADGFEDGQLDGWLGLDPPGSAAGDGTGGEASAARRGRRAPPLRASARTRRGELEQGPADIALADRVDSTSTASAKAGLERLSVTPAAGTIVAGEALALELTVQADRLLAGDYVGVVRVHSNDPLRPEVAVVVNVHVDADPVIEAAPSELAFGEVPLGLSEERSIVVSNSGLSTLTVDAIDIDHADFTANADRFELAPERSRALRVTFAPSSPEDATATLTLHNDSADGAYAVPLAGTGIQGAELAVTPTELAQAQFRGETVARTLTLYNRGAEPLDYTVAVRASGPALNSVTLLDDDMESGAGGWTTQAYGGDDLWWWNDFRFFSESHAWGCTTEDGDYATANPISSAAISPAVDLRTVGGRVTLRFRESYTTEPGWDQCMVDVSIDGGDHWTPLRGAYGSAPSGSSRGWVQENLPLSPFAGEIVRVRFYFETVDAQNNVFPGWSFDDVQIVAEDVPWLAVSPVTGTLGPGASAPLEVTFAAPDSRPAATYTAELEITTSAALTPLVAVPVTFDIVVPPRAALQGDPIVVESERLFHVASARTDHRLELPVRPAGPGTVHLAVSGNFAGVDRHARLFAETQSLGPLSGDAACGTASSSRLLSSDELADLAADGVLEAFVRNSAAVAADCDRNRHVVRVEYVGELQGLDFGDVRVGDHAILPVLLTNTGGNELVVSSINSPSADVVVETTAASVPPGATATLAVAWHPTEALPLDTTLDLATNDPARRTIRLPLRGTAQAVFPEVVVATTPLEAALPPHADTIRTRTVVLQNAGSADLAWNALPIAIGHVEPAAGVLPPGESITIAAHLTAVDLDPGDYVTALVLETNDPARPRVDVPLTLHVRLVGLDVFAIDFTPKYATRPGTVEVVLQLPAEFDARNVLTDSVTLHGVAADPAPLLRDVNHDGVDEWILQFDGVLLDAALPIGDSVPVVATGEIDSRAWFLETAWIRGRIEVDPTTPPPP